jgi:hypothetical protein
VRHPDSRRVGAEKNTGPEKLYFVDLGGYDPAEFAERHRNVFVVAEIESNAKYRALKMVREWIEPHRDDLYEAEQAFCLNAALGDDRLHVHVKPSATTRDLAFSCEYIPIRKGR